MRFGRKKTRATTMLPECKTLTEIQKMHVLERT